MKNPYITLNYTIQCTDESTGKIGCFLFDVDHWKNTGKFKAISEVYPNLQEFYTGTLPNERKSIFMERE